ncbi:hypothetical protein [Salinisphaera aquimarina]|uniref:Integrase n=1 Tax=Salinisphaera aquimarina TaxID=2094031 RepID=A0ABV7ERQ7_9GAMM
MPIGLYRDKAGTYYVKHPVTQHQASLRTKDERSARAMYDRMRQIWESDVEKHRDDLIARKMSRPATGSDQKIAAYAADWRVRRLPKLLKKNGKPLADNTRKAYEGFMRREVEKWTPFVDTAIGEATPTLLRQFLRGWIDSPSAYNYVLAGLTRLFRDAVDECLIDANVCKDIDRRSVPQSEVYVTNAQYIDIIRKVEAGAGYESDTEREWIARAVDLIYLVSHNPQDVLSIRDAKIDICNKPIQDQETGEMLYAEIPIARGKTGQEVVIYANEDLLEIIEFFRAWKRQQRLMSEYLVCYPLSMPTRWRRLVGHKVAVAHISRRFTAGARAAGLDGLTLRDVRSKALSDEYVVAGNSDKGGHKTQAMKEHYRRVKLPMRARSDLRRLKG